MWLRASGRVSWGFISVASLLAGWGTQDARADQETGAVQEIVEVELVNLDVRVVDRKGRHVTGLTVEDFELFDGGRRVEITHFAEVEAGVPRGTGAPTSAAGRPAMPSPVTQPDVASRLIVFFDNTATPPGDRRRVADAISAFIAERLDGDLEVMLVVFDGGLRPLTPLTTDGQALQQALSELVESAAGGLEETLDRRSAMSGIHSIFQMYLDAGFDPCREGWVEYVGLATNYAASVENRSAHSIRGLEELISSLGGLPGRKAVLYAGGGVQQRPALDMFHFIGDDLCPEFQQQVFAATSRFDTTMDLGDVAASANVARVTIYALDTAGVRELSVAGAEFDDRRFVPSARTDQIRTANFQNSLFMVADETGGYAILNANRPGPDLDRMVEDLGNFYSLGYPPPASARPGRRREVYLKLSGVAGRKTELRYRRTYSLKTEVEQMAERTLAALLFGVEEDPLEIEIRTGKPQSTEDGGWELPFEVLIPTEKLGSIPSETGAKGLIRIVLTARDAQGRLSVVLQKQVPYQMPDDASKSPQQRFSTLVAVGPEALTLAVGVRDELTKIGSYVLREWEGVAGSR